MYAMATDCKENTEYGAGPHQSAKPETTLRYMKRHHTNVHRQPSGFVRVLVKHTVKHVLPETATRGQQKHHHFYRMLYVSK